MRQPLSFYIERYNMVGKDRRKAAYRFSKQGFDSLLTYIKWEREEAVEKAMRQPELEILKRWRYREVTCNNCFAGGGGWGGQAMTPWTCALCKNTHVHGSTNVPQICNGCAIHNFKCQRCQKSLDE